MPTVKRDQSIYKVLTPEQWETFQVSHMFTGSPVDLSDGFIHLSCAPQLKATLDKWYADQTEVAVLQIEAAQVSSDLKYEVSRGGAEFPHLFADLPMSSVQHVFLVSPEDGVYTLPDNLTGDLPNN